MTRCQVCDSPVRPGRPLCLRCRATFAGLRLVDVGDSAIDDAVAADTVVAIGYPPSLREVVAGDDD